MEGERKMKPMREYLIYYHPKGEKARRAIGFSTLKIIIKGSNKDEVIKKWKKKMGNYGREWIINEVEWIH